MTSKPSQYVLDTNVLLYDPSALHAFEKNTIVIPMVVIEDIGRMKKDVTETGRNARETSRILDELRRNGPLTSGVELPGGGRLVVRVCSGSAVQAMPREFREGRDTLLLATVQELRQQTPSVHTVLVSKDLNIRIKADSLGLEVMDFEAEKVDIDTLYSGVRQLTVPAQLMGRFAEEKAVALDQKLFPNEYVLLTDDADAQHTELGRFDARQARVVRLLSLPDEGISRLKPRNYEQRMALDALLNDEIQLVTLVGKAGTGKTLLAVAASLYKTVEQNVYGRILVSRPTLPMGKDIGFLPGTVEEKLTPWMYPIADNVEYLLRAGGKARQKGPGFRELIDSGVLVIEPLTYIRGRSIHNQFLIVDEAQNLTPHEIKTIITRVGDGTKTIVTGDPYQIDNPYIDSSSNGLAYLVERFKGEAISAHITLKKGERSALSELAANLL
jgi:PhoH-like ATPase